MNAPIKIDRGIPIPPMRGEAQKYPFQHMQEGDSFFVPVPPERHFESVRANLTHHMRHVLRSHPTARFTTRIEGQGIRVWCVNAAKRVTKGRAA